MRNRKMKLTDSAGQRHAFVVHDFGRFRRSNAETSIFSSTLATAPIPTTTFHQGEMPSLDRVENSARNDGRPTVQGCQQYSTGIPSCRERKERRRDKPDQPPMLLDAPRQGDLLADLGARGLGERYLGGVALDADDLCAGGDGADVYHQDFVFG